MSNKRSNINHNMLVFSLICLTVLSGSLLELNKLSSREDNNIKKYSPKGEYKEIADMWHSICTSLPKVRMITDARRAKIKTRLSEFGDDPMATLRTIFEKIQASDFCKGDNDRHWQADFDWVFENDTNWVKVVEGKYDNLQPPKAQEQHATTPKIVYDRNGNPIKQRKWE